VVKEIPFPTQSLVEGKESSRFYRDSFKFSSSKTNLDAKRVYHAIFAYLPNSVQRALKVRNAIVKPFGFSASNTEMSLPLEEIKSGKKAGFLTIEQVTDEEVVCGAYENNMDMWLSVMKVAEGEYAVSTLVNLKTTTGRLYMALIKPFHKLVAKYCIKQAIKAGRL